MLVAPAGLSAAITATALAGTTIATVATALAMTTLQKTLIATALAAMLSTGIYETRQASTLRGQVNTLQQQQAALNEQIQELTRERDEAMRRLAAVPDDDLLNRATAELLKLRGEMTQLRASTQPNGNDPTQTAAQAWLERVIQLKRHLEQHPEAKIPELQFVTEDEWLRVTIGAFKTDDKDGTEGAYRRALGSLRQLGKMAFSKEASRALLSYASAHNGQFPADLSQLKSFFQVPIDDAILQRYGIFPAGSLGDTRATGEWVLAEITSPDEDLDYRYVTSAGGSDAVRFKQPRSKEKVARINAQIQLLIPVLEPVGNAYAAAHEGSQPASAEQMTSYASTPQQQSALQKLIELQKEVVAFVSPTRHLIQQPANGGK